MLVIEYDVYVCKIQGDITMCEAGYSICLCVYAWVCSLITCDLVEALSGDMIVLIDPFSITLEVDLGGRRCPAA